MLLRTRMRLPGQWSYAPPVDMVWDAARGTASSLRQRVADLYSLPVEKIEIAKYFPDKFEWLLVSSWVRSWGFLGEARPSWPGEQLHSDCSGVGNLGRT